MEKKAVQVSFVICSYNTASHLEKCLRSLLESVKPVEFEVTVVDNGSTDGSAEMVRTKFPTVRLIANAQNRWFTGANNQGMKASCGKYIYILAPDTQMTEGTVGKMVRFMETNPAAGAVTCRMFYPDGQFHTNGSIDFGLKLALMNCTFLGHIFPMFKRAWSRAYTYEGEKWENNKEVNVVGDSNILIKKEVLERTGLYDENMKLYYTENDLCMRIRKEGQSIFYIADGKVIHHVRASVSKDNIRIVAKVYQEDTAVYFRKYYGPATAILLDGLIRFTNLLLSVRYAKRENLFTRFLTKPED